MTNVKLNRVALVTGGTRGVGFGIAGCLAADGYDLAVCGVREERAVAAALDTLRGSGGKVLYVQADISRRAAREQLLEQVRAHFGALNLLVNNAGVAPKVRADILATAEEDFEWLLRINLYGPFFLTQAVARWMIAQKKDRQEYSGCIITITSVSAAMASVNRPEYCISKAGLAMASQLWAARLAEFEIPVYEVRPGIIKTDMTAPVQEKYDRLIENGLIPQRRWGRPEDVGRAVAALARGDFAYSTGQMVMVDGGLSLSRL